MLQRAAPAHFVAELDQMHAFFAACGALTRNGDGLQGVDITKAPADAVAIYGRLLQTGYANGWI